MTITEAYKICDDYRRKAIPTEDDFFMYTEAMEFLIAEKKDPDDMVRLGGAYYDRREFDLALKYYEMAAEYDSLWANQGLGYIWYYGRTGERDYEKAFHYYSRAAELGSLNAVYKVADMYKNGYYVEKDYEKYKQMIEDLYADVEDAYNIYAPLPEVFMRLAKIRTEEGKTDEALSLYDRARTFLAMRIQDSAFFGDLTNMKWLISDVYKLRSFDPDDFELYDLYYLFRQPAKVRFSYFECDYLIEAVMEGDECVVHFEDKWYHDIDDFFKKATLDGDLLTARYEELYDFEIVPQ